MAQEKKYRLTVNCETGEQVSEEFTAEEYAQAELDAQAYAQAQAERESAEAEAAAVKASAIAKLSALGLTEAEAASIIG